MIRMPSPLRELRAGPRCLVGKGQHLFLERMTDCRFTAASLVFRTGAMKKVNGREVPAVDIVLGRATKVLLDQSPWEEITTSA